MTIPFDDTVGYSVSIDHVLDAILESKDGKCADDHGLTSEHFKNAPLALHQRLVVLFNKMLRHAFVPRQFKLGFMIPVVKDNQGNLSDTANYRGITISPVASKLFERVLKNLFSDFLTTSSYQFGFKKRSSTVHALHCLKETVNYYCENKSRVYCSFLDASKAFNRLVHSGLFLKMIERKMPLAFIQIIMVWHDGLECRVKWIDYYSDWFPITAGVRQGGVLSPDLYCLYVDDLINILKKLGIGRGESLVQWISAKRVTVG